MYGLTHVECVRFLRLFKMSAAPRLAATTSLLALASSDDLVFFGNVSHVYVHN